MGRLRTISIGFVAVVLAACAAETVEQRVLRETAASQLEQFAYDGYPSNFPEIAERLRGEAEAGNVRSQSRLAELYFYGFGVPRDETERVKWHRRAAAAGSALSQYFLAWSYLKGEVVEQDYRHALELYRRSAAQDFEAARIQQDCLRPKQRKLGIDTESVPSADTDTEYSKLRSYAAKRIERDFNSGVAWWGAGCEAKYDKYALEGFFSAANAGFAKAQYLIGVAYLSGRGIRADNARAAHWFFKAASQNHWPARREYCALYRAGKTAPADGPPNSVWCAGILEP